MKNDPIAYFEALKCFLDKVSVTGKNGKTHKFKEAIDKSMQLIVKQTASGGKLIFIGNGGSASIASHMATDFCKNAGIRAMVFNDSSLITCISNDYGYKHVFEKPIEMFADRDDILFAISSSGKSENILRGVSSAKKRGAKVITFSGFDKNNPLRKLGNINFYVPVKHYGYVEIAHLSICHCLVDAFIGLKNG